MLYSYHKTCEMVVNDPGLRDLDNKPPPRSIWFVEEELELWRKDRETERKNRDR